MGQGLRALAVSFPAPTGWLTTVSESISMAANTSDVEGTRRGRVAHACKQAKQ